MRHSKSFGAESVWVAHIFSEAVLRIGLTLLSEYPSKHLLDIRLIQRVQASLGREDRD